STSSSRTTSCWRWCAAPVSIRRRSARCWPSWRRVFPPTALGRASAGRKSAAFSHRQRKDGFQPGIVVLEEDVAAVQLCHGAHQAEAEAIARRAAAPFKPDKAIEHRLATVGGNAGTAIGDLEPRPVALLPHGKRDTARGRVF